MHRLYAGVRVGLLILLCASAILAQRDLATLVGTVNDPSGGVVPNAKVTITEVEPVGHYAIRPTFSDGHDTGNNGTDFTVATTPTPGAANQADTVGVHSRV